MVLIVMDKNCATSNGKLSLANVPGSFQTQCSQILQGMFDTAVAREEFLETASNIGIRALDAEGGTKERLAFIAVKYEELHRHEGSGE